MAPIVQDQQAISHPATRAPLPFARHEVATLAMQRFRCTGGECPDSCCRDFGIPLDKESRVRLLALDRERVLQMTVPNLRGAKRVDSLVALDDHGGCPMLESSGRCELQRKYGETSLSTACSVFPRTSLKVGDQLEICGSLACPELARLTLLFEDGIEQDASPTVLLPRDYVGKTIPAFDETSDPYLANFRIVRSALCEIFALRTLPLASRLMVAAHLAARVHDFFHEGTLAFAGKKQHFAHQRLVMEMDSAKGTPLHHELHRELRKFSGNDRAVLGSVLSLLRQRLRLPHPPRFATAVGLLAGDDAGLTGRLRERSTILETQLPGVIDRILSRYARHYLLRSPYTDAHDLLAYLGRLALSLAAVRTLALASPTVTDLIAEPCAPKDDADVLAKLLADTAQLFTKAVSHHADFLATFLQAFECQPGTTFGRLALFARYLS